MPLSLLVKRFHYIIEGFIQCFEFLASLLMEGISIVRTHFDNWFQRKHHEICPLRERPPVDHEDIQKIKWVDKLPLTLV